MSLADILAIVAVVVVMPVNWYVTVRLRLVMLRVPGNRVLRERTIAEFTLAIVATVFGLIFLNNDQAIPPLDTDATKLITRGAIILTILPGLYWLRLYRRARRRSDIPPDPRA